MMYLFRKFISTIKNYLAGKGNLISLLFFWWLLLNAFAVIGGFYMLVAFIKLSDYPTVKYLGAILCLLLSIMGLIITIIYPVIFIISLWSCAKNAAYQSITIIMRLLIIPFCFCHLYLSVAYMMGSVTLFYAFMDAFSKSI